MVQPLHHMWADLKTLFRRHCQKSVLTPEYLQLQKLFVSASMFGARITIVVVHQHQQQTLVQVTSPLLCVVKHRTKKTGVVIASALFVCCQAFKDQDYPEAVKHYTEALARGPPKVNP